MKGTILKNLKPSFLGIGVLIGVLLFSSIVNAAVIDPDQRPDWWADADAKVFFDLLPTADILTPTQSEGTKGYDYTASLSVLSASTPTFDIELTSLTIHLDNEEKPDHTKQFWVAFHYGSSYDPEPSSVNILGHYEDGSISPVTAFDSFRIDDGWVYAEASLFPQPAREDITIQVHGELNGMTFYNVDYLEVGTDCTPTPIPSSLFLLGGGLFWLINLKRRKN